MEFKELQEKILKVTQGYEKTFNLKIDEDFALLKLNEEAGEFAQAVLIHRKKSRPEKHLPEEQSKELVGEELADMLGMIVVNADRLGIDLEKAIEKKWFKWLKE